eukprot:COSAG01_NODE_5263_length_4376_cov_3.153612_3_plen_101_part_00
MPCCDAFAQHPWLLPLLLASWRTNPRPALSAGALSALSGAYPQILLLFVYTAHHFLSLSLCCSVNPVSANVILFHLPPSKRIHAASSGGDTLCTIDLVHV